jgi:hypothetical protein
MSRSRSNSSGSGEEEGGLKRVRSVESLCEGELRGNMNYSDEERDDSPPRMMMGAMLGAAQAMKAPKVRMDDFAERN